MCISSFLDLTIINILPYLLQNSLFNKVYDCILEAEAENKHFR